MRVTRRAILAAALVAALPLGAAVPSPESWFGHKMGADRTVVDWDRVVSYFRALEKNSDRIRVSELGPSTEGRPFIAATIASADSIRRLDRYTWIQQKLADPRRTPQAEADALIAEGKVVVMITCSIHATELASTPASMELVYKLLTDDANPRYRAILENTIFVLVPSLNPDGLDLVTRWYRKTLGTNYEGTSPPELYQKYIGHDNNRDWYMFTQAETRLAVSKLHNVWHPQIVYDVHQQGSYASRMFVPPWMDPIEPNIDPLLAQWCNAIGMSMAADLTAAGKTGIAVNAIYDFWSPARHYQAYHGGMRILTEAASANLATPITVSPDQISDSSLGYNPRESTWNHLQPWMGGDWRLRDIVDYELIAMESCLYNAAIRRQDLLASFYRVGKHAVEREAPYAFVIPAAQRDPGAARKMLETLAFGMVEIERAAQPFEAGGNQYQPGSYVIRLRQPYGAFAKTLLERQKYPDLRLYPGGPPKRPYDVTAHTLPLLMGVDVDTIAKPFQAALEPAKFEPRAQAQATRSKLAGSDTGTWAAINSIWKSGGTVWRDPVTGDFSLTERSYLVEVKRPRIGLYKSFVPSMDEGWTRWVLEQSGFDYVSLGNREIQAGSLGDRVDVIVFADQSPSAITRGFRLGTMPEEYTGGLGEKGAAALKQFAASGGRLIFLNRATEYASEALGLGIKNVIRGVPSREYYSPGSLLRVGLDKSPLTLGLPEEIAIWSEESPAWEVPDGTGIKSAARYPQAQLLASGWLLGEKYLAGRSALVDCPLGKGRVVLFGMRPQYRGQSYQAYKLLFNALLAY